MADWLFESAPATSESLIGYSVLDAVGMRFGQVDGWLRDPSEEVVMFSMTVRTLMRTQRVLIPLGYVTQLDIGRRNLHLREITRRSLDSYSVRFDGGPLPSAELLIDKLRESPYVRPEIRLLLANPQSVEPMRPTRMWTLGDGRADVPPASAPTPPEPPLEPPVWTPIAPLGDDLVPSWRSLDSTVYRPGEEPPAWR